MPRSSSGSSFGRSRSFAALTAGQGTDHDVQIAVPEHFGGRIGFSIRSGLLQETVDDLKTEFLMRLLTAFEAEFDADLEIVPQKFDRMRHFGLKIVRVDVGTELNVLHFSAGRFVAFFGFGFLIKEFAVVHDPADGRRRGRSNFDQVELPVSCQLKGGVECHDAQLSFFVVNDPDFASADLSVPAVQRFVTLEFSEWGWHQFLQDKATESAGPKAGAWLGLEMA